MLALGEWWLTPERVAVHRPTGTAVVADLHLGYAAARRRRGDAVPDRGVREAVGPLLTALAREGVKAVVVAGDLVEEGRRAEAAALAQEFHAVLTAAGVERLALVPGNHDRGLPDLALTSERLELGTWSVVHGDRRRPPGPVVQGHEHPCVRLPGLPAAPCYLIGDGHLVLPAYSRDAAGVAVSGAGRWGPYRCAVIAGDVVLDFGPAAALARL